VEKLNGFDPHCHCRYLHLTAAFAVKKKPRKAFECFSGLLICFQENILLNEKA